ncbi:MAG: DUF45 domain-containing protein [Gallionella sp.]|nr:DUF45 domain-containing protein [Gallionella sp.]
MPASTKTMCWYLIAADGWQAGNDAANGLIPPSLIIARYFAAEREAIEQLEAGRDAISRQLEELDEEHGGEEGLLAEAKNEKGKLTKATVAARLKEIKSDKEATDERKLLNAYRLKLKELIPPLVAHWEPVIGVKVGDWQVKKMKTKWGTCNIAAGRIWLNLELAKKSAQCLEYIIVHEMVHLLERHHNDHFAELMNRFMPQWRLHREELNRSALGHEEWDY